MAHQRLSAQEALVVTRVRGNGSSGVCLKSFNQSARPLSRVRDEVARIALLDQHLHTPGAFNIE